MGKKHSGSSGHGVNLEAALAALLHHAGGSMRVTRAALDAAATAHVEVIDDDDGASVTLKLHRTGAEA